MAMKLVKLPPVVKWNGILVEEMVLEGVTYQAFAKDGGNSHYQENGIEWPSLENNVCFGKKITKDCEWLTVNKNFKISTKPSLASHKENSYLLQPKAKFSTKEWKELGSWCLCEAEPLLSAQMFTRERNQFLPNWIYHYLGSISYLVRVIPCYRLNIYPPKFICWSPIPNVMVLEGGTLERWLGHEDGGLRNGISAL